MDQETDLVRRYHEATKHHPHRYARSLGRLDWACQPDPFRRYDGAPVVRLPIPTRAPLARGSAEPSWDAVRAGRVAGDPLPVNEATVGDFFYHSLALSAWKQVRGPDGPVVSRWALRVNPSSGNLHPTEAWLVDGRGVHHYAPDRHVLELRGAWGDGVGERFDAVTLGLPAGSFLVAVGSIPWREAWKYGERAFRYCQHDAGHALAALGLAAARLGWTARRLEGVGTDELSALLGLDTSDPHEFEHADALLAVVPGAWPGGALRAKPPLPAQWFGQANRLSADHHDWPIIGEMARAVGAPAESVWAAPLPATKATTATPAATAAADDGAGIAAERPLAATTLIRGRRSAVAMDGRTSLMAAAFHRLLAALLPRSSTADDPVLRAVGPEVDVALLLLVHRVVDVTPGLYLLCRAADHEAELRRALRADFAWRRPPGCPDGLPLFLLGTGDLREAARQVSCGQDIAADGAFSVGLLARFDASLRARGPAAWSRLFQETGAVGQLLYLEAEAAGLRGTGIGCFFDDEVHRAVGLVDRSWQSLYHFTVGGPVDDPRLQTVPAYAVDRNGKDDDDGP